MPNLFSWGALLTGAVVAASCAALPGERPSNDPNPRIEYRPLIAAFPHLRESRPATDDAVPAVIRPTYAGDTPVVASKGTRPLAETTTPVFIDFANESATLNPSQLDVARLKAEHDQGKHFFVIGQSHGLSAVGVQALAVKRAQAVARALLNAGMDSSRIHTLASWSQSRESFAPNKGVQIFVVDLGHDPSRALLALQGS